MLVSIIICTRNRADNLGLTLESIGKADIPPGWNVELLVVDNGSKDHTHSIVKAARLNNVVLRYVNEPTLGVNYARNTGLRETTGEIVLWTDDDIRVPTNWVEAMCQPILQHGADAVSGGVIFPPGIAAEMSQQLFASLGSWFASTDDLDPIHPARMVGANMAFHRRVLDRVPNFDVELGPGPHSTGCGSETMFSWQLLAAGYTVAGALEVAVEHHFDLRRLNAERLIGVAHQMGRTHAFIFHHWEHKRSRFAYPRLIFSKAKEWCRRGLRLMTSGEAKLSLLTLRVEEQQAFYQGYLALCHLPRKYSFHGLSPLAKKPLGQFVKSDASRGGQSRNSRLQPSTHSYAPVPSNCTPDHPLTSAVD